MLRLEKLPADTRLLFDALAGDDKMAPFFLTGGTALTLFWGHRQSEDLDFVAPTSLLPFQNCDAIIESLVDQRWVLQDVIDSEAALHAAREGYELRDIKRDYACQAEGGSPVKLTFFADNSVVRAHCFQSPLADRAKQYGKIKVLPPDVIFVLKSQLLMDRTTTRDLFDMMTFLDKGWSIEDMVREIQQSNKFASDEMIRARLLRWPTPLTDPGIAQLIKDDSPGPDETVTLEQIRARLANYFNSYEERLSRGLLQEPPPGPKGMTP